MVFLLLVTDIVELESDQVHAFYFLTNLVEKMGKSGVRNFAINCINNTITWNVAFHFLF